MENEKKAGGDKYSKLAGNTIIFAISSFSSKLLTLIVQPFLTYAMAEISDLGLSKILSQYANLLIPFRVNGNVQRHHPLRPRQGQQRKAGVHQRPAHHPRGLWHPCALLASGAVPARHGPVRPAHLYLRPHELPAHPLHPVRAQPPVEQAGGCGRRALHRGDHGLLCALSGGLPLGARTATCWPSSAATSSVCSS